MDLQIFHRGYYIFQLNFLKLKFKARTNDEPFNLIIQNIMTAFQNEVVKMKRDASILHGLHGQPLILYWITVINRANNRSSAVNKVVQNLHEDSYFYETDPVETIGEYVGLTLERMVNSNQGIFL